MTKRFKSPFRPDKHPDFAFFKDKENSNIYYGYDFATSKRYDIFQALSETKGISYAQAIVYVAKVYNVESVLKSLKIKISGVTEPSKTLYERYKNALKKQVEENIRSSENEEDAKESGTKFQFDLRWGSERAREFLLARNPEYIRMSPVNLSLAEAPVIKWEERHWATSKDSDPCFIWSETDDYGNLKHRQIYRPYAKKKDKFRNLDKEPFVSIGDHRSWSKVVILSKGFKDAFFIGSSGFNVFFKTGEGKSFETSFKERLKHYFPKAEHLIILFDPDDAGIKAAKRSEAEFKPYFKSISSITFCENKDFDETCLKHGLGKAKKLLKHKIHEKIKNKR
jgi:DNA primase